MALRFVPAASHPSSIASSSLSTGAPSARSVPDTIRNGGPAPVASSVNVAHPLESRLKNWESTQHDLKMEQLKRVFGAAEPIRREMELFFAGDDYRPMLLGERSAVHEDILKGKDWDISWEDVYKGSDNVFEMPDFHTEVEQKLKMNW